MRKFREIVESNTAPQIQNLWLNKGALMYFSNNGWEVLFKSTFQPVLDNILEVKMTNEDFTKVLNGLSVPLKIDKANSNYDIINIKVGEYNYYLGRTIKTNGTASYTVTNIINDNINSMDAVVSEGIVTISSNLTSLREILELEIGNNELVKATNLETLKGKNLFFTCLDYGYGVGSWQPSTGGKVHVITADGVFVFYTINSDGSIIKISEKDLDSLEGLPSGGKQGLVLTSTGTGSAEWKDNIPGEINYTGLEDLYSYGVEWDITVSDPSCIRIGNPLLHKSLPVQSLYRGCVAKGNKISYYLDPNDWSKKADGSPSRLDGTDGSVRVHIPKFYGKSGKSGNKKWVRMSTVRIDNTWQEIPEMLLDAYKVTLDNTIPATPKAVSVVNTTTLFRGGGNRIANDAYLATDPFRSDLGKPRTVISRATMRLYARNANSEILCYEYYKWVIYWAFVVEYATFNSQATFNANLTPEGYHLGGLGNGVTTMSAWDKYNGFYPITPCGYTNEIGNFTGIKNLVIPQFTHSTPEQTLNTQTLSTVRYRGIENPFGDIWTNLDGIILERIAADDPSNVYTTDVSANFGDDNAAKGKMWIAGIEIPMDGYTKEFDLGERGEIIPFLVGGSPTTFKCDYHYCNVKYTGLRTLVVGGDAHLGGAAGLGSFNSHYGVGSAYAFVGFFTVTVVK